MAGSEYTAEERYMDPFFNNTITSHSLVEACGLQSRQHSGLAIAFESQLAIYMRLPVPIRDPLTTQLIELYFGDLIQATLEAPDPVPPTLRLILAVAFRADSVTPLVRHPTFTDNIMERIVRSPDEQASPHLCRLLGILICCKAEFKISTSGMKDKLIRKLKIWVGNSSGFALETAEQTLLLVSNPQVKTATAGIRKTIMGYKVMKGPPPTGPSGLHGLVHVLRSDPGSGQPVGIVPLVEHCWKPGCDATHCADGTPLQKCGKCTKALYCDRQHQKEHWPTHKKSCVAAQ